MFKWLTVLAFGVMATVGIQAADGPALTPADRDEIQGLYARYALGFDSGDAQMLGSVFTTDGTLINAGKLIGDSREKIAARARPRASLNGMRHILTNFMIDPSPEGAAGVQYLMLLNFQDGKAASIIGGGMYRDVIVKTAEGWRFKRREMIAFSEPPAPPAATKP